MPIVANRKTNWAKWRHIPKVKCWQAVALSLDIDPDHVKHSADGWMANGHLFNESQVFLDRLDILLANMGRPSGPQVTSLDMASSADGTVDLVSFAKWACSPELAWKPIPDELVKIATRGDAPIQLSKWPWGDHETHLLRCMEAAAKKWWANYDPTDPTTAPNKERQVVPWLKEKYQLSDRKADAIDTILRIEGLPKGPRG